MQYTKEEKLNIGRRIYDGEISRIQTAKEHKYCIHIKAPPILRLIDSRLRPGCIHLS